MEVHGFRRQWMSARGWILAAAAGFAIIAAILIVTNHSATAPPAVLRRVESRLSGVPWAPYRAGAPVTSASSLPIAKNRGEAIAASNSRGVRELLAGRPRQAIASLAAEARVSGDAKVWNNLAVARHEAALDIDVPELLADALAAADRALELDPAMAEALFNRALTIEYLGLRDDARQAWTHYLDIDSDSEWAVEARAHRERLAPLEPFLNVLDRDYERVANDPAAAASLVALDAFGARSMGLKEVLGRWGRAVVANDAAEANRHLQVARRLGAAIAAHGGDHMLARSVAAIDASDGDARMRLAAAHVAYQDGVAALENSGVVAAEPLLRRAADAFAKNGSPLFISARILAANTRTEQGQPEVAERQLRDLLAIMPSDLPAYRAFTLREIGTCRNKQGDYGAAIALFSESLAGFEQVREAHNVGVVRRLLTFAVDLTGDPVTAWIHCVASLRALGPHSSKDLAKTIAAIAEAAMRRHDWQTASSFLTLHIDIARRRGDHYQLASASLSRALVRDRLGDPRGAHAALAVAKQAAGRLEDSSYRELLHIEELRVTAMLTGTSAAQAQSLLSQAIDFRTRRGDSLDLPGLLLQRARARRSIGDDGAAMADLERGMAELERHRESLPQGEARWGAFHAAEDLFVDAIDVAMTGNDADKAFGFAERARARALLDAYRGSPDLDHRRLPDATVVVEYVALPSRLVIFTADVSGVRATTVAISRDELTKEIEQFTRSLRDSRSGSEKRAASVVYGRLIAPVAARLEGATNLVFVPDAVTSPVSFCALVDERGDYLVQRFASVNAPSAATFAAAFAAATERRLAMPAPRSALLITADDAAADSGALPHVEAEMREVARLYANATRITDDTAQYDELVARAPNADLIAFGGHAIGDERGYEPASIVLRQNGRERRVSASEIAKLRLRRTSVVVLAGCSTARGERRAAEGVISVAHGFLSAGAPSVIATLWPIADDAAATFFPRLHRRIAEGLAPAEALREVQIESIRRGDVPASLWAAVQDIGS